MFGIDATQLEMLNMIIIAAVCSFHNRILYSIQLFCLALLASIALYVAYQLDKTREEKPFHCNKVLLCSHSVSYSIAQHTICLCLLLSKSFVPYFWFFAFNFLFFMYNPMKIRFKNGNVFEEFLLNIERERERDISFLRSAQQKPKTK